MKTPDDVAEMLRLNTRAAREALRGAAMGGRELIEQLRLGITYAPKRIIS